MGGGPKAGMSPSAPPQTLSFSPQLGETYGEIFTFHLGSRPCVVLSGYRLLKEALIDHAEEFSGRGDFAAVQQWSRGNGETPPPTMLPWGFLGSRCWCLTPFCWWGVSPIPGIVYGNGERWRQLRRFAILTLKSFGMGKRGAEERVRDEAQHLIQQLYQTQGMAPRRTPPQGFFHPPCPNAVLPTPTQF